MKTPLFPMTPDYTPMVKIMEMQTKFAVEASQSFMKLAMMPWQGLGSTGFSATASEVKEAEAPAPVAAPATEADEPATEAASVADVVTMDAPGETPVIEEAPAVEETVAAEVSSDAPEVEAVVETAPVADAPAADVVVEDVAETVSEDLEEAHEAPAALEGPLGTADDLTVLNGVGPKLATSLNEAGIFHYAQIADWSDANVAWVDANVPGVRGRCSKNAWVAQARDLAG